MYICKRIIINIYVPSRDSCKVDVEPGAKIFKTLNDYKL